jgi:hypothetical protein
MKSRLWVILFCFLAGCGPSDPQDARFKGTWKHITENGLTKEKGELAITITADHDRFRLAQKSNYGETIEVFDNHTLYTKYVSSPGAFPLEPSTPTVSAEAVTVTQTGSRRFWANAITAGHGDPGGVIAGQDTLLYKRGEHRPDGDISEQDWVDAKTGVLLKSISTIYSSQVNSIVRQETWECQSIVYNQVDESDFKSP